MVPQLVDDRSVRLLVLVRQVRLRLGRHASLGLLKKNVYVNFAFRGSVKVVQPLRLVGCMGIKWRVTSAISTSNLDRLEEGEVCVRVRPSTTES